MTLALPAGRRRHAARRRRGSGAARAGRGAPGSRVLIVSGSVGAGHDGAAAELAARLRAAGVTVEVSDFLDALPRPAAALLRDGYATSIGRAPFVFEELFRQLERGGLVWRGSCRLAALGRRVVAGWFTAGVDGGRFDLVVSTFPSASQCLGQLRAAGVIDVPVVTYLTDPAPHRSWVHPAVDEHLTVTAATAAEGRAAYGVTMRPVGPLVPARFAAPAPAGEPARTAAGLGLPAGRPVALLVAGSLGLGDVLPTVTEVAAAGFTPLVLCGRNETLRAQVAAVPAAVALGWRADVHLLMRLADVLVHNAGGLSFTEALVAGLPAVTYRPIPGHGRANAATLHRAGLAPWVRRADDLPAVLHAQAAAGRRRSVGGDPASAVLALLRPAGTASAA